MVRAWDGKAWGWLAAGTVIGVALCGALAVGIHVGQRLSPRVGLPGLEEVKLQAMASHGSDTFAIATGPIDEEVEGLFTLDFLTGDLQCFVVNARAATPGGHFKTNIAKDLTFERGKKPNYLIATGSLAVRGSAGNARPAACLAYIVDANTGDVACYTFPWSRALATAGAPQPMREMMLVAKWKTRALELRQ